MGGGGGPGRDIPQEVIQDALNAGEDFTLEENQTSTFTEDFEIPVGRTFTNDGTIDLGDINYGAGISLEISGLKLARKNPEEIMFAIDKKNAIKEIDEKNNIKKKKL